MTPLDILTHGNNCWPDLTDAQGQSTFITGRLVGIARLPNATKKGKSTVTVRVELPDGRTVLAQTTLALLGAAMAAFKIAEEMDRTPMLVLKKGDLVRYRILSGLFASQQPHVCRVDKFERVPLPYVILGHPLYNPGDILVSISPQLEPSNQFGPSMRVQPGEIEFAPLDSDTFTLYMGRADQIGSEIE